MKLEDHYRVWFRGDEDAVRFASDAFDAAQEWDDLEDEGKCRHNALLNWLAFDKEYDPFFTRHASILRPVMKSVALQWSVANVLDHEDVTKSYMLRAGIYGLFHIMAWLCGGPNWADEIGPEIYRMYGETLAELKEELCPVP